MGNIAIKTGDCYQHPSNAGTRRCAATLRNPCEPNGTLRVGKNLRIASELPAINSRPLAKGDDINVRSEPEGETWMVSRADKVIA